jgi:hypothetical protein
LNIFRRQGAGVLVAPNKCASSYAMHIIPKRYQTDKQTVKNFYSDERVYCLVRDPVEWYVSGWRYASSHFIKECLESNYQNNFDNHLELCLDLQNNYNGEQPSQFSVHCWYDPIAQGNRWGNGIDEIVQIENQTKFNMVMRMFGANDPIKKRNVYSKEMIDSRRKGKPYFDKPKLSKHTIKLLKEICKWDKTAGYDLDQSIKKYINTLCY